MADAPNMAAIEALANYCAIQTADQWRQRGKALHDLVAQRMRTLNSEQSRRQQENHVCPFPLDIPRRLIERFTNRGELVLDPFGGLGSTAYEAIRLGRRGLLWELNDSYWWQSAGYCRRAEAQRSAPSLFDALAGADDDRRAA